MPSTINAQVTPFPAIVQEADSTGVLALQTANVTAVTIDASQNAAFANTVSATSFVGAANASSLSTGTVPTARLATGTADSSTYLRGDQTWAVVTQTRVSGGTTGLTPATLSSGDVTLAGTLSATNGGTGLTSPGTSGNILTSNGTTWVSSTPASPGILTNGTYGVGTTYSLSVTGTRPVILSMNYAGVQGGNAYIQVQFQWGFNSLTDSWTPIQSGVNYVVYPAPCITVVLTPPGTSSLQFRVDTINLGNQQFFVSAIQL
jgi:hypothetical protein